MIFLRHRQPLLGYVADPQDRDLEGLAEMDAGLIRTARCLFCQREVDREAAVFISPGRGELWCLCKKHLRPDEEAESEEGTLVR